MTIMTDDDNKCWLLGSWQPKWTRHNLMALWDGQPFTTKEERTTNKAECDRIFIALHRFQTEGKVAYRRLCGMHGGGGGTKCNKFRDILDKKVKKDIKSHTGYDEKYPDNGYWPGPVPNASPTLKVDKDDENRCFAYTFCWHAQPEFIMWHRPLMAEFERGLQDYDPKYGDDVPHDDARRHSGPDALGAPYWGWEGWDGLSLPQVVANPVYVIKTDKWKDQGYPEGSILPNPFHRWFAPVSLQDQRNEIFPSTLADHNTTTRSSAFTDQGTEFSHHWEQMSSPNKPSMKEVVERAIQNPNYLQFSTMNKDCGSSTWSIENAHNKFHNHIGGMTKGGIQGSGNPEIDVGAIDPKTGEMLLTKYSGTMAQNQSTFDPIFWLHHGNIERQFCSWQRLHCKGDKEKADENSALSTPPNDVMDRILYPWTKPELLFKGSLSWNTASDENGTADASFRDWWNMKDLPYKYDAYLEPTWPARTKHKAFRMKVYIKKSLYKGGEYDLFYTPTSTNVQELVGAVSVLSGVGGVCAQCSNRNVPQAAIAYEVCETFQTISAAENAFENGELSLTLDDDEIEIEKVVVTDWE